MCDVPDNAEDVGSGHARCCRLETAGDDAGRERGILHLRPQGRAWPPRALWFPPRWLLRRQATVTKGSRKAPHGVHGPSAHGDMRAAAVNEEIAESGEVRYVRGMALSVESRRTSRESCGFRGRGAMSRPTEDAGGRRS